MNITKSDLYNSFFKDKKGKIVIWQFPNGLLLSWIATKLFAYLISESQMKNDISQFGSALLFTWAYLEITKGDSYFRRTLGLAVFIGVLISFFK